MGPKFDLRPPPDLKRCGPHRYLAPLGLLWRTAVIIYLNTTLSHVRKSMFCLPQAYLLWMCLLTRLDWCQRLHIKENLNPKTQSLNSNSFSTQLKRLIMIKQQWFIVASITSKPLHFIISIFQPFLCSFKQTKNQLPNIMKSSLISQQQMFKNRNKVQRGAVLFLPRNSLLFEGKHFDVVMLFGQYITLKERKMEINKKQRGNQPKEYIQVLTYTQNIQPQQVMSPEPASRLGLALNISPTIENDSGDNQSSTHSIKNITNTKLITSRRKRKKYFSKESSPKTSLLSSHPRQAREPDSVHKVIRVSDLIKLFLEKLSLNSVHRRPVEYDPYENQFKIIKSKLIQGIQQIHLPKIVENALIIGRIFFILLYIFVFPLTLIFQEIQRGQINVTMKAFGIFFCFVDILELCQEEVVQDQSQTISLEGFNKKIAAKKNGLIFKTITIALTIISLVLSLCQSRVGSLFFVVVSFNIKEYLNNFSIIEDHFFTATHHEKYWNLVKVLSLNLVVCHLLACVLIAVASIHPQDSWMTTNMINLGPWYQQYIWSYYFGTTIILTIGFGDLHPGNYIEAFFIIIISFCACLFFGYNINYIGNLINLIKQDQVEKNNKLKVFNSLAKRTQVSKATLGQITNYIVQSSKIKKQSNYAQEKELIQQLPQGLRSSFLAEANQKVFNHLKKIIRFTNRTIERLSLNIEAKICHPDQIIKKKGQPFSLMILQSGEVGFMAHLKESRLHHLIIQRISNTIDQQSKLICVDILQNKQLTYDIKSLAYSIVYEMNQTTFEDCIRQSKEDFQIYRETLDRCRYRLNQFGILKCRYCDNKQHTLFQCPRLHFQPFQKTLPFKYNLKTKEKQDRVKWMRNKQNINFYDYAAVDPSSFSSCSLIPSEAKISIKSVTRHGRQGSKINRCSFTQMKSRQNFLMTMEMVNQLREDIQRLKVQKSQSNFEFALWDCTDCDQICNFKYYFPRYNPSELDDKLIKTTLMNITKSYKKKLTRKTLTYS